MPYGLQYFTNIDRNGDGRDGSISYSVTNSRWEDGNGAALSNEARWTGVATTTLIILKECLFQNVTVPVGATLQLGANDSYGICMVHVNGTLDVAGTVTAGRVGLQAPGVGNLVPDGGAAKSTAGVGNASGVMFADIRHGVPGACGGGGGDGTNAGGSRAVLAGVSTQQAISTFTVVQGSIVSAGTTGAGVSGLAPTQLSGVVSQFESPWLQWPSAHGIGGSGGALKQAGGANVGGAGGAGGRGKLPIRIRCRNLVTAATALIHNDGNNGSNGSNGVATNAAGDISGGGGGGGGSSGGAIGIEYSSWTDAGATIRSNGGSGGTGGLGYEFNGVLRATSNGGNGAAGTNGLILMQKYTG